MIMNLTWILLSNANNFSIHLNCNNQTSDDIHYSLISSSTILSLTNGSLMTIIPNNIISSKITNLFLIFLVSFITLITLLGNLLVIIAFIREPPIRTYSNYFILNLSIADLLVGLICIPLYAHAFISGQWYLGYHLCKFWLFFDYVVGSASTLCIVVISYDRYQMVSKGLDYLSKLTIRRVLKFVLGVWIIATLNYGPAIILWDWLPGSELYDYQKCDPPFAKNFPYLVTTAFVEFFVPVFSLATLNLLVYLNIRQRSRGLIRTNTLRLKTNGSHSKLIKTTLQKDHEISSTIPSTTNYSKSTSLARDRRAAKNLFILVFVFVLCWFPYTLLSLIRALCTQADKCVSSFVYEITFWLLWLNSTINPLLYSFLHVKFRQAFYRIICFYKHKHRHRLRIDQI